MSNLEQVIARLLSDPVFRERVRLDGSVALLEYNLTVDELTAILHLNLEHWISPSGASGPEIGQLP